MLTRSSDTPTRNGPNLNGNGSQVRTGNKDFNALNESAPPVIQPLTPSVSRQANPFINRKYLNYGNYALTGLSAGLNLATFTAGNFTDNDGLVEGLEKASKVSTNFAVAGSGIIGAIDTAKKNSVAFAGNLMEAAIPFLSTQFDLWSNRGISQSLINGMKIIDSRRVYDESGDPVLNANKTIKYMSGDFSDQPWHKSITTTAKELPKIFSELFNQPKKIFQISYSLAMSSALEFTGAVLGLFGMKTAGSIFRNIGGAKADFSFATDIDKTEDTNVEGRGFIDTVKAFDINSPFARAGATWISAAVLDEVKRFQYFTDKFKNLTQLSLFFDRLATAQFVQGNLNIKK